MEISRRKIALSICRFSRLLYRCEDRKRCIIRSIIFVFAGQFLSSEQTTYAIEFGATKTTLAKMQSNISNRTRSQTKKKSELENFFTFVFNHSNGIAHNPSFNESNRHISQTAKKLPLNMSSPEIKSKRPTDDLAPHGQTKKKRRQN